MAASASAFAGASDAQKKGFIQNDSGQKCWYKQTVDAGSKYFHGSLAATVATITFDDPACMKDSGLGLGINKMMINNVISRWYSRSDAAFQTRENELYPGSMMQKKGQCIQSKKYPAVGIVVDYVGTASSIKKVLHGSAVQGSTK